MVLPPVLPLQAPTAALDTLHRFVDSCSAELARLKHELEVVTRERDALKAEHTNLKKRYDPMRLVLQAETRAGKEVEEALRAVRMGREQREAKMRADEDEIACDREELKARLTEFTQVVEQTGQNQERRLNASVEKPVIHPR